MNKTTHVSPSGGSGLFAPSGFFAKRKVRVNQRIPFVVRRPYEAATPAQTARLCEVLGRGMSSHLRF